MRFISGTSFINDVVCRDTESYFSILYQDNNRKPICRLNTDGKKMQLLIPDENIPRLVLESGSFDVLLERTQFAVPELLFLNVS